MAAVSGTSTRYSLVGFREDLEDTIWELFPEDTWLLSNLEQVGATSSNHEWQSDSLAAAAANRQIEGDDAAFATLVATVRLNNFQQISRKTLIISGTALASTAAGNANSIGRQAEKLMLELKRDMELALVGNQASSDGGTGTARSSAGMESWIAGPTQDPGTAGNVVRATTTANTATTPGFSGGTVVSPTDGATTGALTSQVLNNALEGAWVDGGDPSIILVNSRQKAAIDNFTSVATRFVDVDRGTQASVIGAINVYVSDFGRHSVVLHRYMRQSVVLAIDPKFWAVSFLRRPFLGPLADTGDARKRIMLTEYGLVARAPGTSTLAGSSAKVVACT
jgi:uncharacterized protein DUF5309